MRPSCRRWAVGEASWPPSASCLRPSEAAPPTPAPHPSSFTRAWDSKPCGSAAPAGAGRGTRAVRWGRARWGSLGRHLPLLSATTPPPSV